MLGKGFGILFVKGRTAIHLRHSTVAKTFAIEHLSPLVQHPTTQLVHLSATLPHHLTTHLTHWALTHTLTTHLPHLSATLALAHLALTTPLATFHPQFIQLSQLFRRQNLGQSQLTFGLNSFPLLHRLNAGYGILCGKTFVHYFQFRLLIVRQIQFLKHAHFGLTHPFTGTLGCTITTILSHQRKARCQKGKN